MKRWVIILAVLGIIWWLYAKYSGIKPGLVMENVATDFNESVDKPEIDETAHVSSQATVIGNVQVGKAVYLAPHSFLRGDEGQPLHIGDSSNIQDGAGVHALETEEMEASGEWKKLNNRLYTATGELITGEDVGKKEGYAVYIGKRVSVAHQSLVHGPAYVDDSTFIGMQSQVFNAKVGKHVAIGVRSLITGGVSIPDNSYIAPGSVITTQEQADALPSRVGSPYENTNDAVVHVNVSLAYGYNGEEIERHEAEAVHTVKEVAKTNDTTAAVQPEAEVKVEEKTNKPAEHTGSKH